MTVATRVVPARWIALIGEELNRNQVPGAMIINLDRIFAHVAANPGSRPLVLSPEAPALAIYHGMIGPQRSVLVEIALAVEEGCPPGKGITVRQEPEHVEAYVELKAGEFGKTSLEYAQEQLALWVGEHGTPHVTLRAREIYVADLRVAGPQEHVADVVLPFMPRGEQG